MTPAQRDYLPRLLLIAGAIILIATSASVCVEKWQACEGTPIVDGFGRIVCIPTPQEAP